MRRSRNQCFEILGLQIAREGDLRKFARGVAVKRGVPFQRNRNLPGIPSRGKNRLPFAQVSGRDREFERRSRRKCSGSVNLGGTSRGSQFGQLQLAGTSTVDALNVRCEWKLRVHWPRRRR